MKKIILTMLVICFSVATICSQNLQSSQRANKQIEDNYVPNSIIIQQNHQTRGVGDSFPSTLGTKMVVGKTTYDLQTNGALQDRILVQGNEIHVGWTMSHEANVSSTSAFADRGTGYNYFNGTAWGAPPTSRIENVRTGFGGIGINGVGNPIYVSHEFGAQQILLSEKTMSGWSNAVSTLTTNKGYWPHIATSGNWLYVMTGSDDSTVKTNGIQYGHFFSRSNDNGATWIDNMIDMPLIDSVGHFYGGGNTYSISARDSIVAIVFGRIGTDLTLLQSNDYGATWSKKIIWDWPLEYFDFFSANMTDTNNDNTPDTLWAIDGSMDVAIDKGGEVHVAFPILRVYKDGSSTGYSFFFRTLMSYYNSIGDSVRFVDDIFADHHISCDGDSLFSAIPGYSTGTNGDAIYRTSGLLTMPQVTVNENNNDIYITYTCVMDGDLTEIDIAHPFWLGVSGIDGQPYRDIMVLASNDKGATFGYPVNITRTRHYEEVYPSVPDRVNGTDLHFLYQGDIEPGNILQNMDTYDVDFENWMIYQKVAITDIFSAGANSNAPCNQFELPLAAENIVKIDNGSIMIYPNPAVDFFNIEIDLNKQADKVSYELYDLTGRLISKVNHENITTDKVQFSLAGMAAGNYVLKVNADDALSSHKISVR